VAEAPLVLDFTQKGKARRQAEIASGRRHAIEQTKYQGDDRWTRCSCGFEVQGDRSIRYVVRRDNVMAQAMDQHIAESNRRKSWQDEEDEE
jgi:hypothetical protein